LTFELNKTFIINDFKFYNIINSIEMLQIRYKCNLCNGLGHTERWAEKKSDNMFIIKLNKLFRTTTCDRCIGTGINLHMMSNAILLN
jgi:hypothetical protein